MDLMDMQKFQIRGYKYLFNAIDMSSRYYYSVALKNKTDVEVLNGFKKIYNKSKTKAVRSDNGSEFINKKFKDYLDKNGIKQILGEAGKPQSNGLIERANATIKELIEKALEMNEKFDWIKNLDKTYRKILIIHNIVLQDIHQNEIQKRHTRMMTMLFWALLVTKN